MKTLILGLNYAPEPVGIGPYTAGLAKALSNAGHQVTVVSGKPYYPFWKLDPEYQSRGYRRDHEDGVTIIRCPIYVPGNPNGARRLLHHASFALSALPVLLRQVARSRPEAVIAIAPSLIAAPVARLAARLAGARYLLHVQDFEVEAAFATGLLDNGGFVSKLARAFEGTNLRAADRTSTISPQMCRKLLERRVPRERIVEFRNWADIDRIVPLSGNSPYRREWSIDRPHVAFYSGNIANKQGIEIIVEAARRLVDRRDLMFVVCGNGPNRERLVSLASGLDNILFFDLQPESRLSELLGMASLHLLPQIAGAADLVLPSKLANMLASGRPVVATAAAGTGLAAEVDGCGLVTPPGDAAAFAAAIGQLLDNPDLRRDFGRAARMRAEERWSRNAILSRYIASIDAMVSEGRSSTSNDTAASQITSAL